uniref:Chloroplast protein-transporting ATPase n=1 Tax=Panagrolaimus superbus TaxID=310955 RepID=A0A914YI04_9BILA
MLRHTSTNNNQLEKMSLTEWIAAAEKQKYFDVSDAIKDFGSVGYYIIYLKQQGRSEADLIEKCLTTPKKEYHIPEKLIAQVCSLITYNEVDLNEEYLAHLDALLTFITEHSGIKPIGKHIFVTNECDQTRMIQKFENSEAYQKVISEKVRNVDVIANLIKGVHDSDLLTRKQASQKIANIIKNPGKSKVMRLLEKFDNCMKVLRKGISLRDTQKMAIMYAIESNSNLLSQVNTGEGKSYIVAAIAIIRASQFQSVDIITSSPVLAQRDSAEMKDLYEAMSINIDHNCHEDVEMRKQAYKANVVYGEIGRFQRDYLLHHFYRKNILGDRSRENSCS